MQIFEFAAYFCAVLVFVYEKIFILAPGNEISDTGILVVVAALTKRE